MHSSYHAFNPRRTHRKRISTSRLSSDTVTTLPEYTSPPWHRHSESVEDTPSDKPPDYPDSAEEADEDTDDESVEGSQTVYVPQPAPSPSLHTSPRRHSVRRFPSHRRQSASTSRGDPFLDSLLERSVHALEMSNTLLQSSQATQSSLSVLLASDSPADRTLEARARGLSTKIRGTRDVHESWMDDLDEISRGVEGLFGAGREGVAGNLTESPVSRSLPTSSMPPQARRAHRRMPSLDLRKTSSNSDTPSLHLSNLDRSQIISPPPRALTQYVESTADPDSIHLPSTLGLRASSSSYSSECWTSREASASSSDVRLGLHASPSLPVLTDRPSEPSTPAYNMLSSFVKRASSSGSSTPCSSMTSRPSFGRPRRGSNSTERGNSHSNPRIAQTSPDRGFLGRRRSASRSRSVTPNRPSTPPPAPRPMTPPIEELSASSSGSSDAHPTGYRTVQSLRKILDEQPPPPPPPEPQRPRAPAFLPRTPAPAPTAGTSTATASVSRLFTKGTHSSSTRPPSPPRQSSMKQRSAPSTPSHTPSPSTLSIPDVFGRGSGSSSGLSTPKRISFAALPESYSGSRPGGGSSRFKDKKRKRTKRAGGVHKDASDSEREGVGWWTKWFLGSPELPSSLGSSVSVQRHEERVEERIARGWGGRSGLSGGLDDWAI